MLKIENLRAEFEGEEILRGVDFLVDSGEIHVILGPNGSGKSTLGRVILGDDRYRRTAGRIDFLGQDFSKISSDARARAGFFLSFQDPPAIDGVRVRDFLLATKRSVEPEFSSTFRFGKMLEKILADLKLSPDFANRSMNCGFSGGERKKMEIAAMEILNPKLAFLDEIDSGVDVDAVRVMAGKIRDFVQKDGKSVVIVSHSEKLLREISPDRVHVFCGGRVVRSGDAELIAEIHRDGFRCFEKCGAR